MKISNLINNVEGEKNQFAHDVIKGLSSSPKFISSKYFYDNIGSDLFQKITRTTDYYLTSCEYTILQTTSQDISKIINHKILDIIELGAGDGHKSKLIIDAFLKSQSLINYYPIDISQQAMFFLEHNLASQIAAHGIVAEYVEGLAYVKNISPNPKLVLFLGSSIGNFSPKNSLEFLRAVKNNINPGDHVIIGFDLKKDLNILYKAYNDSEGLTRKFNLNILTRVNNNLKANFILDNFEHYGFYNPNYGAMESFLISLCDQDIYIKELDMSINFNKFEPLHLEYSYKYSLPEIKTLSEESGFRIIDNFCDDKNYFVNSLWQAI